MAHLPSDLHTAAKRLRWVRQLMGLSRQKIRHRYGIAPATIQAWEGNKAISDKALQRFLHVCEAEGIQVTAAWIRDGVGSAPSWRQDTVPPLIQCELDYFYEHNTGAIHRVVTSHALFPMFEYGDVVAGIRQYGEAMASCVGWYCIHQIPEQAPVVGLLKASSTPNRYHIMVPNIQHPHAAFVMDTTLISAAPIIWIRKPYQMAEPLRHDETPV